MISQRFYRSVSLFVRLSVSSSLCSGSSSSSNRNSSGSISSSCGWLNRICDLLAWNCKREMPSTIMGKIRGTFCVLGASLLPSPPPLRWGVYCTVWGEGKRKIFFPSTFSRSAVYFLSVRSRVSSLEENVRFVIVIDLSKIHGFLHFILTQDKWKLTFLAQSHHD